MYVPASDARLRFIFLDYLGRKNYPSLTNRELLSNLMGSVDNSRHFIKQWLLFKKQMADFNFKEILIN